MKLLFNLLRLLTIFSFVFVSCNISENETNNNNIKYGVTRVIPVETIIDFIRRNYDFLLNNGYALDNFK